MNPTRIAVLALCALPLAGCGLLSVGGSDKNNPHDPNRTVAKMLANITSLTFFTDTDTGAKAVYRATLYDDKGNQFFGPTVQLDGTDVPTATTGETATTIYQKDSIDFTPGQTFTTTVQGHAAVSPGMLPQLQITSPVKAPGKDNSNPPKDILLPYYKQPAQEGVTVTWTGGDPSQPVFIFVFGSPDTNSARRLLPSDDTSKSPSDPENFGSPIPNTGSYTIPAQITERYVSTNGAIATRTVYTFDDPVTTDTAGRSFTVYVVQRNTTSTPPITFSAISGGNVVASVHPKT